MSDDDRTEHQRQGQHPAARCCVDHYRVHVRGRLGARWTAWFDGLQLSDEGDGTTVISGRVVDQAALHGLLLKLRDLGLPLLSLTRTTPEDGLERRSDPADPTTSPDAQGATP